MKLTRREHGQLYVATAASVHAKLAKLVFAHREQRVLCMLSAREWQGTEMAKRFVRLAREHTHVVVSLLRRLRCVEQQPHWMLPTEAVRRGLEKCAAVPGEEPSQEAQP